MRAILTAIFIVLLSFGPTFAELSKKDLEEIRKIVKEELAQTEKVNQVRFQQIDKRFEDVNRRIDDVNKRIDMLVTFLWILSGIYTALLAVCIGLIFWDRKTFSKYLKEEILKELVKEGKLAEILKTRP